MVNTSTSIHFHGINQRNSTWMDGVAGVTQCPIPPGENYTYEFTCIEQRGTFWYHAHTGVQYTDGLFGPIVRGVADAASGAMSSPPERVLLTGCQVIHDPDEKTPPYDDEKIIFMGDHYHTYAGLVRELTTNTLCPSLPTSDAPLTTSSSSKAISNLGPSGHRPSRAWSRSPTTSSSTAST